MMWKVVYYTDSPEFGGSEQALLRLMGSLDRRIWNPVLFCHPEPGLSSLMEAAQALDIPLAVLPPLPLGTKGLRHFPAFIRRLMAEKPDVFHANLTWPLSCKWGLVGAILSRIPAILATHNLFLDIHYSFRTRIQQRWLAVSMGRSIAISSEIARRLRQEFWLPSEKLEVIYNGVQLQQFNRAADARKRAALVGDTPRPVILSVARYSQQKGLNYLIEAAARVPQAMFLLAGEGPERQSLELQANELGLHSRVLFLGYRNDIPDLLALCDLFVLPSVYEGMPIALIEAMGAGKPVIATDLPGCKELITHGENGWIIPAADSLTLADSIQMLLKNPELAQRLGQAGQAYVRERLSMDIVTRRITQLYTELLVKPESVPGS